MNKEYKFKLKKYFKERMTTKDLLSLAKVYVFFKKIFWPVTNMLRLLILKRRSGLKFHLGCGEKEIADFINIDERVTVAADITMDLNNFHYKKDKVSVIFSNAFFEHLYRYKRVDHLKNVYEALNEDGFVCYIGMPYFRNIAKYYLDKAPGTFGEVFDLYNVYRYTHGDPELALNDGWYLGQLHKSLFDEEEISGMLTAANFSNFVIFAYVFPFDKNPLPVTCGFYATKNKKSEEELRSDARKFLDQFSSQYLVPDSMDFLKV